MNSPLFSSSDSTSLVPRLLSSRRLIWFILLIATVVRAGFAVRQPSMEWDAESYRNVARHLATEQGYTSDGLHPETYWAPLTPFLIAGVYKLGGGDLVVREVWALCGTCLVLALYAIGRVRHGLVVANLAALVATFYPYNIVVGSSTSTEIPSVALILLTIFSLGSWLVAGKLIYSLFAGITLGLAILDRPAAVVFLTFGALLHLSKPASTSGSRRLTACLVFLLTAASFFVPWSVRTSRVSGTHCIVTSGGPWNLWFGNNPWMKDYLGGKMSDDDIGRRMRAVIPADAGTQGQKDKAVLSALWRFITTEPKSELRLLAFKTVQFWQIPGVTALSTERSVASLRRVILMVGFSTYVPLVILSVLSVLSHIRARRIDDIAVYLGWILLTFLSYIWFPAVNRFRFAGGLDNLMIILSAIYVSNKIIGMRQPARLHPGNRTALAGRFPLTTPSWDCGRPGQSPHWGQNLFLDFKTLLSCGPQGPVPLAVSSEL